MNLSLYAAKFLITSYTSILAPLLPVLMANLQFSLTQAGVLVSVFSLFNSLLQPLFGWIQDRIGYHVFLCAGPLWAGLCMGALGAAPNFGSLVLLLLLGGLGICAFHPASFAAVGGIGPERRAIVISFLLLAASLGFVVGPVLISLYVSAAGMEHLLFIAVPGILTSLVLCRIIPRSGPSVRGKEKPLRAFTSAAALIAPLFLFVLCISITAMNLYSFVPIMLREKGAAVSVTGFFLSAFAMGCALGPLSGSLLARRFGRSKVIVLSTVLSIAFLLVFLKARSATPGQMTSFFLLGLFLMGPFSILMDMAQERAPRYLSTVSSLLGGFAWGCGGVLVIFFAMIGEVWGIENVIGGLLLFLLINLGLAFKAPALRSG